MGSLSAEQFDADPDHEAYWAGVTEVLHNADRQAIPSLAQQKSLNHLEHMLSIQGIGSFEAWVQDLAESFADAYVLADAEEWELDPETAQEFIDDCMFAVNTGRLAVGSDAITASEPSTWLSLILLGLSSDLDEWEPLNSYIREQAGPNCCHLAYSGSVAEPAFSGDSSTSGNTGLTL